MNKSLIRTEKFNTNNSWGFGGGFGKRDYYENGVMLTRGTASFRHAPNQGYRKAHLIMNDEVGELEVPVHKSVSKAMWTEAKIEDIFSSDELYLYKNDSGGRVALVVNAGDSFTHNYHDYTFDGIHKI